MLSMIYWYTPIKWSLFPFIGYHLVKIHCCLTYLKENHFGRSLKYEETHCCPNLLGRDPLFPQQPFSQRGCRKCRTQRGNGWRQPPVRPLANAGTSSWYSLRSDQGTSGTCYGTSRQPIVKEKRPSVNKTTFHLHCTIIKMGHRQKEWGYKVPSSFLSK